MVASSVLPAHPVPQRAETVSLVGGRTVRLAGAGEGSDRLLSRVAADAGTAVGAVVAFWGTDWSDDVSQDIVVQAAGSDEEFQSAAGGGSAAQWADIAAVTVFERVDPVRRSVRGQRIVFAPGALDMSVASLRIVLTHELFHYAARADTALDAPQWLTEGVADYVARPQTGPPADAGPAALSLPVDADLDTPGPQRSRAYDRAWWFARFVADTYGPAKLRDLYLSACGAGHPDPAISVRHVLGVDTQVLLTRWQQWLNR